MKRILPVILFFLISTTTFATNPGIVTYQMACSNCHSPTLAKRIGAPAAFDKKAWDIRFKQAKIAVKNHPERYKTQLDYLLSSVIRGKNLMHHGGLCRESNLHKKNCTHEAYIQAIQYMSGK